MVAAAPPPQNDSSSDEEVQAFYVGGSDHSGQQVLGPKKKKKTASFVDRVLEDVRTQMPPELTALARGGEVTVNMEDKRGETFKAPKQAKKAFTGEGRTLGSISPTTVGMTAEATESDKKADEERAKQELKVNPAEPTTNIQLRLADGSRVVAQFNHTHTLRDVRMFIIRARPQYEVSLFSLMTAFPSHELTDEMSTLKDLNLLNAVIIQHVVG